jgi:hypothetical protein
MNGFSRLVTFNPYALSAIRTYHFPGEMPVPSQECVVFQLFSLLKTQMVELIGFVCDLK